MLLEAPSINFPIWVAEADPDQPIGRGRDRSQRAMHILEDGKKGKGIVGTVGLVVLIPRALRDAITMWIH